MNRLRSAFLAISGGLLMALSLPQCFPLISLREIDPAGHLELLAWVALVPVLLALDGATRRLGAMALGLLAGLAYFYGAIWWVNHAMTAFGGVPLPIALAGLSLLVLFMALHWAAALTASFAIRRRTGWPLWTHLPAVWTAFELLRNYLLTGFPWGNLGYTQARHTAIAQLASVTGVYGIAALVVLVNCALYALARALLDRGPIPLKPLGAAAGALVAVLAFGAAHLASVRARASVAPRLRIGLVQGNVSQDVKNEARRHADTAEYVLERYGPLSLAAERQGAVLVAWPEATYPYMVRPDLASFAGPRAGLPPLARAHLLLGALTYAERRLPGGGVERTGSNSAFLLAPGGRVLGRYVKHHLVPFGEYVPLQALLGKVLRSVVPLMVQQAPGSELVPLDLPLPGGGHARLATMICFDAIFPEVNVAFAELEPEILLNPTNDAWYGYSSGPYQFLAMVRMRAVEAGRGLARPAYAGVTALVEPTGEVQPGALPLGPVDPDLAPDPEEGPRLLVGELPRLHGRTLYTTVGDLFAYAASLYGVAALLLALRGRRPS